MDEEVLRTARNYIRKHRVILRERLGFGIHRMVFVVESNIKAGRSAVKFHERAEPYHRKKSVYTRLAEHHVSEILGFHVPQLLSFNDEFYAIEMTIVRRPFVLDFADAYLDQAPDFSEEVLEQWDKDKREIFGEKFATVLEVLQELRGHGVHLLDINAANITFTRGI